MSFNLFFLRFSSYNFLLIFAEFFVGVTDHFASDDEHALLITRRIVANLNIKKTPTVTLPEGIPQPPLYDPTDIYGIIPKDTKKTFDVRHVRKKSKKRENEFGFGKI